MTLLAFTTGACLRGCSRSVFNQNHRSKARQGLARQQIATMQVRFKSSFGDSKNRLDDLVHARKVVFIDVSNEL